MEFSSESGAVLPCSARGQPTPRITWERKDGSPAPPVSPFTDSVALSRALGESRRARFLRACGNSVLNCPMCRVDPRR
ncbi:unnamed protein product [Ixodes pacificus]